ncbi:MAG: hypothetical protein IPF88_14540 [Candidatus Microthrix sp.]|nr:hypothetical protein [Candidatus Microthrix sp.]MBK6439749.1 hypothetical protein [Candidatus Microthrix sp.]
MPRSPDDAGNDGERAGTNPGQCRSRTGEAERGQRDRCGDAPLGGDHADHGGEEGTRNVVPMISAVLSFSPNVRVAKSLAQLGTLSTTTLPHGQHRGLHRGKERCDQLGDAECGARCDQTGGCAGD